MTATWDMTSYFDQFDGPQYRAFRDEYKQEVAAVQQRAASLGPLVEENLEQWAALLADAEGLVVRASHLFSYLGCLSAADSADEAVSREYAALQAAYAEHQKVEVHVLAAFEQAGDAVFERLAVHPALDGAAYKLGRMREQARRRMPAELEALAADLSVDGISAWGRLYDQVAGRLKFEMPDGDGTQQVPMALKNSLLESPDPTVRRAALDGSNEAWARMEEVTAAALNAIAGTRLVLYKRRGVEHFLDEALFSAAISHRTLETMLGVIEARCGVAREYLREKARLAGVERLAFCDIECPLPLDDVRPVSWSEATERIESAFGSFYPALAEFARMSFERNWIDSQVRPDKRPGGFCSSSYHNCESRVFMTFNDTLGDVQTLAHELGHAFHNWVMRDMRPWQRGYPMTLAETASTFAETLFTDALLADPSTSARERAIVLTTRLDGAAAFLLNIPMRFYFERAFYEERAAGPLPVSRFKELMLDAQRRCYGDCLDGERLDPYFWASKLHFYISGLSFYNYPYSFGFLFSLGVFAMAKQQGAAFLPRYEDLLRLTGSDTAENVARRALGVELEAPDFWEDSIALVEQDLADWRAAVPAALGR